MSNRYRRAKQLVALSGGAFAAAPLIGGSVAHASAYTVTNTNASGPGSLAEAVGWANVAGDADTIVFDAGVSGSIRLADTLEINYPLSIVGPGDNELSIVAPADDRVFYMTSGDLSAVSISGLSLVSGTSASNGGAIYARGVDLSLDDVWIGASEAATSGGGVYFSGDGTLHIEHSTITGNTASFGGGIYIEGSIPILEISDSVISGNTAIGGGGLYSGYWVSGTVTRVRFSGNTALAAGGGASLQPRSGGALSFIDCEVFDNAAATTGGGFNIEGPDAAVTIDGSTFWGNTAGTAGGGLYLGVVREDAIIDTSTFAFNSAPVGGGIFVRDTTYYGGSLSVSHSTITLNTATVDGPVAGGGGIMAHNGMLPAAQPIVLDHTVVAGNVAPDADLGGRDIAYDDGGFSATWSMIGDRDGFSVTGSNNLPEGDAMLGWGDNGDVMRLVYPSPDSPLIDAGDPAYSGSRLTDQRGWPRVYNWRIDIGAVEFFYIPETGASTRTTVSIATLATAAGAALAAAGRRRTAQR